MKAVIGSVALNWHVVNVGNPRIRTPADIDLVMSYEDFEDFTRERKSLGDKLLAVYPIDSGSKMVIKTMKTIYECEIAWPDSSAEALLKLIEEDKDSYTSENGFTYPSLNVLYMLKMSHRYLKDSPHFLKTMNDILLMRKMGVEIRPEHWEFYAQRIKATYKNVLPKLNQSKKEFFDNSNGIYTIDHDDIHRAIALLDKPAYEYFKQDMAEVMCSKELFFETPQYIRLLAAYEESCVLSLERSIHPYPGVDRKWAFDTALMKLCTSISSGYFREFCWENYYEIQDMYNESYVDKFYEALHNGLIGKFKGE